MHYKGQAQWRGKCMNRRQSLASLLALAELVQGDHVEAWDRTGARWQGITDVIDPHLGFVWIHTPLGERKLLDVREHIIDRRHWHA